MDRRLLPLNSLRAFEMTGARRSFTKAGEALSVTQSAMSRHVINLEEQLGVKLIERRGNTIELTEQGQAILPELTKAFDILETALSGLNTEERKISLKVSLPPSFAHFGAVPLLTQFQDQNPDINIHLSTPRIAPDLRTDNLDIAVVYAPPQVSDYVMDLLWQEEITPLCHPDLIKDNPLTDPETFLKQQELVHVRLPQSNYLKWENLLRHYDIKINAQTGQVFDTATLSGQYVMAGRGVIATDPKLFTKEIKAGKLVKAFPDLTIPSGHGYYILCRSEDLNNYAIQQLRDWLLQEFTE